MEDIRKPGFNKSTTLREVIVEDFSENEKDFIKKLKDIQVDEAKVVESKTSKLSEAARNRVEQLCGLTRATKEVEIAEVIYSLRSLKSKEMSDIIFQLSKCKNDLEVMIISRKLFLSKSLYKISGMDIDLFLGDNSLEAKFEFFDLLDEIIITKLYEEYQKMSKELNKKFDISSEEKMKEVTEDIKK